MKTPAFAPGCIAPFLLRRGWFSQINAGKIPGFLSGDREVLDELLGHSDITPAMSSTIRVLNVLTSSAGFDSGKVL